MGKDPFKLPCKDKCFSRISCLLQKFSSKDLKLYNLYIERECTKSLNFSMYLNVCTKIFNVMSVPVLMNY